MIICLEMFLLKCGDVRAGLGELFLAARCEFRLLGAALVGGAGQTRPARLATSALSKHPQRQAEAPSEGQNPGGGLEAGKRGQKEKDGETGPKQASRRTIWRNGRRKRVRPRD